MALNIAQAFLVYIAGGITFFILYLLLSMNEEKSKNNTTRYYVQKCDCCLNCGKIDICSSSCLKTKITCNECSMKKK